MLDRYNKVKTWGQGVEKLSILMEIVKQTVGQMVEL